MLKIALTGSTGLIGTRIMELLNSQFSFIQILQEEIDITNKTSVDNKINALDFDILLHMAAFTNVDASEQNQKLAYEVNVIGTRNLYDAVSKKGKKFIYISTDFVFDGTTPPYYENSVPNPQSYYAKTKREGEIIVQNSGMIIRLSYPYRSKFEPKNDFVKTICSKLIKGNKLTMINDSIITPTFIDDIAFAFAYLFNHFQTDTFHIVGSDSLSPYNAGKLIAKIFHFDESLILPISFQDYSKNRAIRPKMSEIKSNKNTFYRMKTFAEGLQEILKQQTS